MHFWVSKLFLLVPKIVCLALDLEPYLSSGTTPYIRHHTFHRSSIANVEIYGAILSSRGKRHNPFGKGHNPSDTHTHTTMHPARVVICLQARSAEPFVICAPRSVHIVLNGTMLFIGLRPRVRTGLPPTFTIVRL